LAVRGIFSPVPAAKVATYFGLQKPKNKRVNGKSTKVVVGLKITAKYIILKAQP
jgi:hypothetical protein